MSEWVTNACHTKNFTGKKKLKPPTAVHVTRWHQDPYSRGSYSYTSVESSHKDVEKLAQPLPCDDDGNQRPLQLLFAGEATHPTYFSTVHGAYESGLREAKRLLNHLQNTHLSQL